VDVSLKEEDGEDAVRLVRPGVAARGDAKREKARE
jgi:hypothetical protein